MLNATKINFKTPGGLKIRLNHRYFFYQLVKTDKYATDEEIVANDVMYNATANIETMYLIPTMLIQAFSLICFVCHIDALSFCVGTALLYAFGCIWRCSKQDLLLSTALMLLTTVYQATWWLIYISLIVLAFLLDSTNLITPYLVMRLTLFILSGVGNHIVLNITVKKYGMPFNDTEICAFRVFHLLSGSDLKLSDYIELYVSTVYKNDETPPVKKRVF